jgi:hypothetical protein
MNVPIHALTANLDAESVLTMLYKCFRKVDDASL